MAKNAGCNGMDTMILDADQQHEMVVTSFRPGGERRLRHVANRDKIGPQGIGPQLGAQSGQDLERASFSFFRFKKQNGRHARNGSVLTNKSSIVSVLFSF